MMASSDFGGRSSSSSKLEPACFLMVGQRLPGRRLLNKFSSGGSGGLVRCMRGFSRTPNMMASSDFVGRSSSSSKLEPACFLMGGQRLPGRRLLNKFSSGGSGGLVRCMRGFSRTPNMMASSDFGGRSSSSSKLEPACFLMVGQRLPGRRLLNKFSSGGSGGLVRCMRGFSRTPNMMASSDFGGRSSSSSELEPACFLMGEQRLPGRRLLNKFSSGGSGGLVLCMRGFSRTPKMIEKSINFWCPKNQINSSDSEPAWLPKKSRQKSIELWEYQKHHIKSILFGF